MSMRGASHVRSVCGVDARDICSHGLAADDANTDGARLALCVCVALVVEAMAAPQRWFCACLSASRADSALLWLLSLHHLLRHAPNHRCDLSSCRSTLAAASAMYLAAAGALLCLWMFLLSLLLLVRSCSSEPRWQLVQQNVRSCWMYCVAARRSRLFSLMHASTQFRKPWHFEMLKA